MSNLYLNGKGQVLVHNLKMIGVEHVDYLINDGHLYIIVNNNPYIIFRTTYDIWEPVEMENPVINGLFTREMTGKKLRFVKKKVTYPL